MTIENKRRDIIASGEVDIEILGGPCFESLSAPQDESKRVKQVMTSDDINTLIADGKLRKGFGENCYALEDMALIGQDTKKIIDPETKKPALIRFEYCTVVNCRTGESSVFDNCTMVGGFHGNTSLFNGCEIYGGQSQMYIGQDS